MRPYKWGIIITVALLLAVGGIRALWQMGTAVPAMAEYSTLPTIIIDPGHGGVDGGAVGVDDIVEKDINLAICMTMRDIFVAAGFDVVMTRDTDISIHDDGVESVRRQKTSDLHNRLAIAQQHPGAVFISVHQNKFQDSRSNGAQIFYGPNNEQSKVLAELLQKRFVAGLQPENHRQCKQAGKNLYLMFNANCPAVLVECGFLSNRDEAYRLVDPEYQSQIAFTTFAAVMEFLQLDSPAIPLTDLPPSGDSDTRPEAQSGEISG